MSAAKGSLTGPRRDEDPDDSPEPQGGRGQLEGAHAADRASQRCDRRDQCHDPRVARGSVCDLASAQNLLDLEAIIIGGGLGDRLGQPFVDRVIKEMTPHLFVPDNLPVVLRTELGDLSGAVGAAVLAGG